MSRRRGESLEESGWVSMVDLLMVLLLLSCIGLVAVWGTWRSSTQRLAKLEQDLGDVTLRSNLESTRADDLGNQLISAQEAATREALRRDAMTRALDELSGRVNSTPGDLTVRIESLCARERDHSRLLEALGVDSFEKAIALASALGNTSIELRDAIARLQIAVTEEKRRTQQKN